MLKLYNFVLNFFLNSIKKESKKKVKKLESEIYKNKKEVLQVENPKSLLNVANTLKIPKHELENRRIVYDAYVSV